MYVDLKFTLEQAMKAQAGSRDIEIYPFFHLGARWIRWSTPHPDHFTPGKRHGTGCTARWVGPRAGLDGCGNLAPPGFDPEPSSP